MSILSWWRRYQSEATAPAAQKRLADAACRLAVKTFNDANPGCHAFGGSVLKPNDDLVPGWIIVVIYIRHGLRMDPPPRKLYSVSSDFTSCTELLDKNYPEAFPSLRGN